MIVPYSAGGSADAMARLMQKYMIEYLGQTLIVENKVGGGATVGFNELASANPDGYTIGYVTPAAILQPVYSKTRYHYPTALEPIAQISSGPLAMAVLSQSDWENVDDLVKYAKDHPTEIKFAHSGLGTLNHVAGEMFAKEANISIIQVPFMGDSEALTMLLGKHVQLMFTNLPELKEFVRTGQVRVLAVSGEKRLIDPIFSNIPTFKEQGLDIVFTIWQGIATPKPLPDNVKGELAFALFQTAKNPEFQARMEGAGMPVEYLGPEEFLAKWLSEMERLPKIVQDTGIVDIIAKQKN
jgi:tripartite-type tricarboxylate transporter receptor subunit TctC